MAIFEGEKIILRAAFSDAEGNVTDPSTPVTISVKQPDGTLDVDDEVVSSISTGIFEYEYTTSQSGTIFYKFESDDGAVEVGKQLVLADKTK